jgi:hypothetical protein
MFCPGTVIIGRYVPDELEDDTTLEGADDVGALVDELGTSDVPHAASTNKRKGNNDFFFMRCNSSSHEIYTISL